MAKKKKGWNPKQGKCSKEGLKEAVRYVKRGGMSKLKESKIYTILITKLHWGLLTLVLVSPTTHLTVLAIKDEEALVGHILVLLRMSERKQCVSAVHDPSKVVRKRGKKSVHSKTSGEQGENATALCCVNAEERVLPPMQIFKEQGVSQALMGNAPENTLVACRPSNLKDMSTFTSAGTSRRRRNRQKHSSRDDINVRFDTRPFRSRENEKPKEKYIPPETVPSKVSNQENKQTTENNTSSKTTDETCKSTETDSNGEGLEKDLKEKGLDPKHWRTFFQEQGLQRKEQFQHIDQVTLNKLLSHTKYTWEKSVLYKLAEDCKKDETLRQEEAAFEKLRSKLQEPQITLRDALKLNDDRRKQINEDKNWLKPFDLDTEVKERLKKETSGQQLVIRQPLKRTILIRQIAGGQLFRGQFMYKNFRTSSTYRKKLIEVEDTIKLMSPEISEIMETFEFTNKTQSDNFDSVLTQSGFSCAVAISKGISAFAGLQIHASGEKTNSENEKNTTNEQKYFVKINQILNVPMASFTLSNQNVNLSVSALKALKYLHRYFEPGKEENDFKDQCKLFFHEFGSHYYTGLCHFGGRYVWTVTSYSTSSEKLKENIKMAKWALSGSIAGGFSWIGIEIKGAVENQSETVVKTHTISEKCEISKKLEKFGGPQEVDDISLWKKGLAEYNNTWMIIDKDVSQKCYAGVWTLIQHQEKEFSNANAFAEKIEQEWKTFYDEFPLAMAWSKGQLTLDESLESKMYKQNTGPKLDNVTQTQMETLQGFNDMPSESQVNARNELVNSKKKNEGLSK